MRTYRRPMRSMRRTVAPRRTTVRRQAFGNFASAMQQRDSTNVVLSLQEECNIIVPQGGKEATLARNVNALLCKAPYFGNYVGMYDQYKINAVRAAIEMTYIGNDLLNQTKFPSVCTSWDRNGIKLNSINVGAAPTEDWHYLLPTYSQVTSYSSANEKTIYYGSRWGVVRQLDAASMMEKSMYIPTSNTRDVLTHGNMYTAWNPELLIGIQTSSAVVTDQSCVLNVHWQFDVTLRGLRKIATADNDLAKLLPNPDFIGYRGDNRGLIVPNGSGGYIIVGSGGATVNPTINPEYNIPTGSGNGLVVPNDGKAGSNIGI